MLVAVDPVNGVKRYSQEEDSLKRVEDILVAENKLFSAANPFYH